MTHFKQTGLILSLTLILGSILACNSPSTPLPGAVPTVTPTEITPTAVPSPTLLPTPSIPEGWTETTSDNPGFSLFLPPGWTLIPRDEKTVDIRQTGAEGWIEVSRLDRATAAGLGIPDPSGRSVTQLAVEMITAAREDGTFGDSQPLPLRGGAHAVFFEGQYDAQSEKVLVALLENGDHVLYVIAHQGEEENWDESLKPLYLQILETLAGK